MNVFIDCGFTNGRATKKFFEKKQGNWLIYGFEPNREYHGQTLDLGDRFRVVLIPAAVWSSDCIKTYYMNRSDHEKNNILGLHEGENEQEEMIVCLDLVEWMTRAIQQTDHVILKLDIEGAEFEVLEHLLDTGKMSIVKHLVIEWHERFFPCPDEKKEHRRKIEDLLATEFPNLQLSTWK